MLGGLESKARRSAMGAVCAVSAVRAARGAFEVGRGRLGGGSAHNNLGRW